MKYDKALDKHYELVQSLKTRQSQEQIRKYLDLFGAERMPEKANLPRWLDDIRKHTAEGAAYYVTSGMCDQFSRISDRIEQEEQGFEVQPWDLLTDSGFVWLEHPLRRMGDEQYLSIISAISWGPVPQGGWVWVAYWVDTRSPAGREVVRAYGNRARAEVFWDELLERFQRGTGLAWLMERIAEGLKHEWMPFRNYTPSLITLDNSSGLSVEETTGKVKDLVEEIGIDAVTEMVTKDIYAWREKWYTDVPVPSITDEELDANQVQAPRFIMDTMAYLQFGHRYEHDELDGRKAVYDARALWALMADKKGRITGVRGSRGARRRVQNDMPKAGDINVIYLRREVDKDPDLREHVGDVQTGYRRHLVRAYWRRQWVGTGLERHQEWRKIDRGDGFACERGQGPLVPTDNLYVLKR